MFGWKKEADSNFPALSIGEYLDREGYSDSFRDNYLIVSIFIFILKILLNLAN